MLLSLWYADTPNNLLQILKGLAATIVWTQCSDRSTHENFHIVLIYLYTYLHLYIQSCRERLTTIDSLHTVIKIQQISPPKGDSGPVHRTYPTITVHCRVYTVDIPDTEIITSCEPLTYPIEDITTPSSWCVRSDLDFFCRWKAIQKHRNVKYVIRNALIESLAALIIGL